jgi:hypothetical protein
MADLFPEPFLEALRKCNPPSKRASARCGHALTGISMREFLDVF